MTPLGKFINKSRLTQKSIASSAGITQERLSGLCNDPTDLLYADEFCSIIKAMGVDFDIACTEIFKNTKLQKRNQSKETDLSKFGKYISKYLMTKKDLSQLLGIQESRFSKLSNDKSKKPYAEELYLLALAFGKLPSEVFREFYGQC